MLLPGEAKPACVVWDVPDDGQKHDIYAVVDPDNTIPETQDDVNNTANVGMFAPDMRVSAPVVTGYPSPDTILVGCTIRNDGDAVAGPSTLEVRRDSDSGELVFSTQLPAIDAGESSSVQFAWDVSGVAMGTYTLAFVADAADSAEESNETNNVATVEVPVMGDLQAEQWSARFEGGTLRLVVRNVGAKPTSVTTVRAVIHEKPLGEVPLDAMNAGESVDVVIPIAEVVPAGWLTITVNPDSDGSDEVTLLNNSATAAIYASGDMTDDGNIDLDDHPYFVDCLGGPGTMPNPTPPTTANECLRAFDFDGDADVDIRDFRALELVFSGSE